MTTEEKIEKLLIELTEASKKPMEVYQAALAESKSYDADMEKQQEVLDRLQKEKYEAEDELRKIKEKNETAKRLMVKKQERLKVLRKEAEELEARNSELSRNAP